MFLFFRGLFDRCLWVIHHLHNPALPPRMRKFQSSGFAMRCIFRCPRPSWMPVRIYAGHRFGHPAMLPDHQYQPDPFCYYKMRVVKIPQALPCGRCWRANIQIFFQLPPVRHGNVFQ